MNRKLTLALVLMLSLLSALGLMSQIQKVEASDTIYIKEDGSIDPPTAPISSADNITYFLTGNIIYDKIVVQRNNIAIDGNNHMIEGTEAYGVSGIDLSSRTNVTVKNVKVMKFYYGIHCLIGGGHIIIVKNNITGNTYGIYAYGSSRNNISENDITHNDYGIYLSSSNNNNISKNNIADNDFYGIWISLSSDNVIFNNRISGSWHGVESYGSDNKFYHNEFIDNWLGHASVSGSNEWDDGYPSGGNYWDDFEEKYPEVEDIYSGPYQNESGSDGIWDHPYLVDAEDVDWFPLVPETNNFTFLLLAILTIALILTAKRSKTFRKDASKTASI